MHESIFDLQATRLRIVHALREGPQCVNKLAELLQLDQAKISQHLTILKSRGIVASQRQGSEVIYHITNPKIERICDLQREVLAEQAAQRSELIQALKQRI